MRRAAPVLLCGGIGGDAPWSDAHRCRDWRTYAPLFGVWREPASTGLTSKPSRSKDVLMSS
jgi:hypothetical protein